MQASNGPFISSAYEPLQLFSQQPAEMHAALGALLRTPQNNLRVFRDGKVVPVACALDIVASWGNGWG